MPLPGLPELRIRTAAEANALRRQRQAEEAAARAAAPPAPPKKARGRPRTKPPRDPDAPKKPRGRPFKRPELDPAKVAAILAEPPPPVAPPPVDPERRKETPASRPARPAPLPPPEAEPLPAAASAPAVDQTPEDSQRHQNAGAGDPQNELARPHTPSLPGIDAGPQDAPPPESTEIAIPEVTVPATVEQRRMVDEYGELDRRMQLRMTDQAKFESLKRAIKGWFDLVPPDADGTVEGENYLLHLSARERERRVRVRDLAERIGVDRTLALATVPISALKEILSDAEISGLTDDARSGSRRIKAIARRAVMRAS